jgi:hypothetical protein
MICQMIDGPVHDNTSLDAFRKVRDGFPLNEVAKEITGLEVGVEMGKCQVGEEVQINV